jgi:hypothetical protein
MIPAINFIVKILAVIIWAIIMCLSILLSIMLWKYDFTEKALEIADMIKDIKEEKK